MNKFHDLALLATARCLIFRLFGHSPTRSSLLLLVELGLLGTPGIAAAQTTDPLLRVAPIEAERDHPTSAVPLPPFPPEPLTRRFILMRYGDRDGQPVAVYLRVPEQFLGTDTSKPSLVDGQALFVKYPQMTGGLAPENRGKMLDCRGPCPGVMRITLANRINEPDYGAKSRFKVLQDDIKLKAKQGLNWFSEETSGRFSTVVDEIIGGNPNNGSNARFFVDRDAQEQAIFFSKCYISSPVHLCDTFVSSEKYPGLEIEYDTRLENIDEWPSIRKSIRELVDGFVETVVDVPNRSAN